MRAKTTVLIILLFLVTPGCNKAEEHIWLDNAHLYINELEAEITYLESKAEREMLSNMSRFINHKNPNISEGVAALIAHSIMEVSKQYNVSADILLAVAYVESTFYHDAVSSAGARGLMQIHPATWFHPERPEQNLIQAGIVRSEDDLFIPSDNIRAGAYILEKYYKNARKNGYKNPMKRALTRYYGGNQNSHYDKICRALGEFYMFVSLTN